ncbi:DUF1836 domain-containing protein [Olsenella uli]|uniref:DUF1836 domain-containing protein n=1 Tax=Olsenella uli TaxID=133926 RepID=UPI00195A1438|nr:DUF1836 domain-containing protein [Olsenella uli]MBM6675512.1 DUF1836 domain-containing protein [Olsenella uli]
MGEKDKIVALPHVDVEARRALAERMRALHITRIGEMPRIELYLDQVLTLVTQELEFMRVPGDATVTGSMVNNYVKQGVIPAPRKKRYTRRHLASLLFVCAFKRVFSIAQVKQLMERIYASGVDLAWLYDETCGLLERSLAACFSPASEEGAFDPGIGEPHGEKSLDPELARLIEAAVASLATRVYVEQTLLLDAGGERR